MTTYKFHVRVALSGTNAATRYAYRVYRKLGFSRHDANMLTVGGVMSGGFVGHVTPTVLRKERSQ